MGVFFQLLELMWFAKERPTSSSAFQRARQEEEELTSLHLIYYPLKYVTYVTILTLSEENHRADYNQNTFIVCALVKFC